MTFRHLKIFAVTVIALVLLAFVSAVGVTFWAFKHPQQAWDFAGKHLLPKDLNVKWEKMDFSAQRRNWKHYDIVWSAQNLTIDKGSPALHVPVSKAQTKFSIRVFEPGPWFRFDEVTLISAQPVTFTPAKADSAQPAQSPFQQLRTYFGYLDTAGQWTTMDSLDLDVPVIEVRGEGAEPLKISVRLAKRTGESKSEFRVDVSQSDLQIGASGGFDANQFFSNKPFLQSKIDLKTAALLAKVSLTGSFDGQTARFDGESNVEYKQGEKPVRAAPNFKLSLSEHEAALDAYAMISDIPGPLVQLDKVNLEVRLPMDNNYMWSERPATFKLYSSLALFFIDKDMRPPLEKSCRCKIPEKLLATVDGRFWPEFLLNNRPERKTIADTNLYIEGVDNKLFSANIAAHVKIDRHDAEWFIEPRLDSQMEVHSFQGLRQFLDAKNVIIPSPLDILDGTIKLKARAGVTRNEKTIRTPIEIEVQLGSNTQKVSVSTTVTLDLAANFKALDVYIQSLIHELKLELPPLDPVLGLPPLARDSRVALAPAKPGKKAADRFKLRVFFDVKTAGGGSIKLLSKLADPFVPVTLDVNNSAQGESSGYLRLEPFTINYLRRKISVERMQVTLSEDESGDFPVGGRVRIDQTSYKIFVDIGGTVQSPSVQLNSEPFLPRNEIISVLLYNRTSENLVSADSETVGSFEAALADRAIGLFGLWAFASTPIRSFSYNAVTKVYTATVELADGLTAGVGTNWERAASLEVRKRVSRRWVLTASWSPSNQNEQVGKLVLQWEKRF